MAGGREGEESLEEAGSGEERAPHSARLRGAAAASAAERTLLGSRNFGAGRGARSPREIAERAHKRPDP